MVSLAMPAADSDVRKVARWSGPTVSSVMMNTGRILTSGAMCLPESDSKPDPTMMS
jgi:hypothetical protein